MTLLSKNVMVLGGLIIVMILGFVLTKLGKPYNGFVFNIHKLVALGIIVLTVIHVRKHLVVADAGALMVVMMILMIVCTIALFATGAMLSIGKIDQVLLRNIHLPTSISLLISTVVFVMMLLKKVS